MQLMSSIFDLHETALRGRSAQLELTAQNIANADTPHFKAKALDFRALMNQARGQQNGDTPALMTTQAGHVTLDASGQAVVSADTTAAALRYRVPFNSSPDGNTVEMSIEQAAYGKAASDYSAVLNFLQSQVSEVKRALKGE
jgi:flagellar basal-body rod protein FlgB